MKVLISRLRLALTRWIAIPLVALMSVVVLQGCSTSDSEGAYATGLTLEYPYQAMPQGFKQRVTITESWSDGRRVTLNSGDIELSDNGTLITANGEETDFNWENGVLLVRENAKVLGTRYLTVSSKNGSVETLKIEVLEGTLVNIKITTDVDVSKNDIVNVPNDHLVRLVAVADFYITETGKRMPFDVTSVADWTLGSNLEDATHKGYGLLLANGSDKEDATTTVTYTPSLSGGSGTAKEDEIRVISKNVTFGASDVVIQVDEDYSFGKGYSTQLTATIPFDGGVWDVTHSDKMVWSTSNSGIAKVTDGLVSAVGVGGVEITAELDGVPGSYNATVEDLGVGVLEVGVLGDDPCDTVGFKCSLTATMKFDGDRKVDVTNQVLWYSSLPENVLVHARTGDANILAGTAVVSAIYNSTDTDDLPIDISGGYSSPKSLGISSAGTLQACPGQQLELQAEATFDNVDGKSQTRQLSNDVSWVSFNPASGDFAQPASNVLVIDEFAQPGETVQVRAEHSASGLVSEEVTVHVIESCDAR